MTANMTSQMARDMYAQQSLGSIHSIVKQSRVLMVGAGGIGCELLKNLVLMNFGHIQIVDLDTIDLSNLNRQFLFRHEHIKQPKAFVAKQVASKFNPAVEIQAHHANIKDQKFTNFWFRQFDIIFNALDNMEARRYVNAKSIALDIPLIESGTTGFLGQSSLIKKGITECYDCREKQMPKSFPVCTIRSEPSQPIHCVVWAKSYLFPEIFGSGADEAKELNFSADDNNENELDLIRREFEALALIKKSVGTEDFARLVFDKVFNQDIKQIAQLEDRWDPRVKPAPVALEFDNLQANFHQATQIASIDQTPWTVEESVAVFVDSISRIAKRLVVLRKSDISASLSFNKDDMDTFDFVTAAANIRSYIFRIRIKSKFDVKQMAGNIIPAIATTNAIMAGASVLHAFKILSEKYTEAKHFFMSTQLQKAERLMMSSFEEPKPGCRVCGITYVETKTDTKATMKDLVQALQDQLGYEDDLTILANDQLLFELGDEDSEQILPTLLSTFNTDIFAIESGTKEGIVLVVEEQSSLEKPVLISPAVVPDKIVDKTGTESDAQRGRSSSSDVVSDVYTKGQFVSRKRAASFQLSERPAAKTKAVHKILQNGGAVEID